MSRTSSTRHDEQMSRHVHDSFQAFLVTGTPPYLTAGAFMTCILGKLTGGAKNKKAFLELVRKEVAALAREVRQPATPLPPLPSDRLLVGVTFDKLAHIRRTASDSIIRVVDLGFDPRLVLLAFGQYAAVTVMKEHGSEAALSWLDQMAEMVDAFPM